MQSSNKFILFNMSDEFTFIFTKIMRTGHVNIK